MDIFLKKLEKSINGLIRPGDKVVVGVSGGADSIALLQVLHELSHPQNYQLVVAHINHMARGKDAFDDACFVKDVADKLGLPFFLKEIDVQKEKVKLKTSFQDAARIIRYKFFNETLAAVEGNRIALGHTADDQVETILINIVRGSGLKGLAGIPQVRDNIIRPLLQIYRKEIEDYLEEKKIAYRNDSSNYENKYLRNRIRHELIPHLESFNPGIKKSLKGMSLIAEEDDFLLSQMTLDIFNQNFQNQGEKDISWSINDFQIHPLALKKRLVRETFHRITGGTQGITALHVQQILNLFDFPKAGKVLNVPRNVEVSCTYSSVEFKINNEKSAENSKKFETDLTAILIPGTTEIPEGQIQVQTQILDEKQGFSSINQHLQAFLDLDKTGISINARFFQPGDRFCPLGMSGSKKLKSFFIDRKVPRHMRHRIPILTNDQGDIIWVYGERISHIYRVTDKTKRVLFLQGNKAINY